MTIPEDRAAVGLPQGKEEPPTRRPVLPRLRILVPERGPATLPAVVLNGDSAPTASARDHR